MGSFEPSVLRTSAGADIGILGNPLRIDPVGVTLQPVGLVSTLQTVNFTGVANSSVFDVSLTPMKYYALVVQSAGGTVIAWDVRLLGGVTSSALSILLQHVTATGLATNLNLTGASPAAFLQLSCAALTLGTAPSINASFLGIQ